MNDLYVQVEVGFPESKLVDRGRVMLGVPGDTVIAKLLRLWLRTIAVGCHGLIGERSDDWIEEAAGWSGETGKFAAFVRLHHLDSDGRIKDWMEKYGALEEGRHKAKVKKRRQRGQSPGQPQGPTGDRPGDVPRDPSPISNLQSQESLSTGTPKKERASLSPDLDERRADALQALTLFLSRYDFGRWRDAVEGFVRSSEKPVNVIAELELHITGEMGRKKNPPEIVGFALNQYAAAHPRDGFKSALFAGFVRGAHRQIEKGQNQQRNDAESAAIRAEQAESEQRAKDERDQQMLMDFERTNEERYVTLKQKAEASVDKRHKGEQRDEMVRGALIALVRKEVR